MAVGKAWARQPKRYTKPISSNGRRAPLRFLRAGSFTEVDIEHAAEEIEDLGGRERSAAASRLIKAQAGPSRDAANPARTDGGSWRRSISEGRSEIEFRFDDSPRLRR